MAKGYVRSFDFRRGLQTRSLEDGKPLPDAEVFANFRVNRGAAYAREGMVLADTAADVTKAVALDGVNEYMVAPVDPRPWTLGTKFTIEICQSLTDKTAANPILYVGSTTPSLVLDCNSSGWRLRVWDSAATLTTLATGQDALQSLETLQIVRDGASLAIYPNNSDVYSISTTMHATNLLRAPVGNIYVGYDGSGYYGGTVDYIRAFNIARSGNTDRLVRFPDPRAEYVLADYSMGLNGDDILKDRSRYGNHLKVGGGTPVNTTALSHPAAQIDGISSYRDAGNRRRIVAVGGGQYSHGSV